MASGTGNRPPRARGPFIRPSNSAHLRIPQRTLETHIRSVFQKLDLPEPEGEDADGVNRRVLAVLAFVRANPAS